MKKTAAIILAASLISGVAQAKDAYTWDQYIKDAAAQSASQNGGKPAYVRDCTPEYKVCIARIAYEDKRGVMTVAREWYNDNDVVIKRDFCLANSSLDIRVCADWDNGRVTKEMKSAGNEWKFVSEGKHLLEETNRWATKKQPSTNDANVDFKMKPGVAY